MPKRDLRFPIHLDGKGGLHLTFDPLPDEPGVTVSSGQPSAALILSIMVDQGTSKEELRVTLRDLCKKLNVRISD